jgi:CRISPR-associated endonuclease/helicase Cas3
MIPEFYREICLRFFGDAPRKYQEITWERFLDNLDRKMIMLVRLPCGYGKTRIGFVPFIAQAVDEHWIIAPRLIYVLPMRSLVNEVVNVTQKVVEKVGKPLVVKALHGEARDTPHLFSDICVATLDSFLYSYARKISVDSPYGDKHVDFTAGSIANSMVVFDEAHMYQGGEIQVLGLFKLVTKYLVKSGIPVIVMTATLPRAIRDFIFDDTPCYDISFKDDEKLFERKYEVHLNQSDILHAGIKDIISTLSYHKLLIVANTVERAARIYKELEDHNCILLHARIRNADRSKRLNEVKDRLKEGHVILVSTQVCEAGLDLDFDTLVTDVAPADSLVQRIGRVARRGGKGTIMICKTEKTIPYDDEIVEATWNWINAHVSGLDLSRFSGTNGIYGTQEFVDECWEPYRKKFDRFPSESELFLSGKGLISEPDLDFSVRGTEYITIIAPYDRERLSSSCKMKREEFDACKFTVDIDMIRKHKEWITHEDNDFRILIYDHEKNGYVLKRESKILPYQAYLCNSSYYDEKLGLWST